MRVLVTWGSKRGGTEGIGRTIADALRAEGLDVEVLPAREASRAARFDAVIVGGALYANRWHRAARRFVSRRRRDLRAVPVWFFSSGPLDDSSDGGDIPPTAEVQRLMEQVGAIGHATFGGRLAPDAKGFPANAMAKTHAGDWRNPARIRTWAAGIARALPGARPEPVVERPGGSPGRLVAHAAGGWALRAAVTGLLGALSLRGVAVGLQPVLVPLIFTFAAMHYFRASGARGSAATAFAFAGIAALLDLVVVAGVVEQSPAIFGSAVRTWIPYALIVVVTWAVGEWRWMVPASRETRARPRKTA